MSTSGSTNFTLNKDEVIKDALILLGVVGPDQSLSGEDSALASRALNRMIKAWLGQGIHLWANQEATIFLVKDQQVYSLNSTTGDHASNTVVETTLSAAEALGQTILSITSTTGMTASDNIGIELDDGTRQWTTIVSVDSSTQVTVTAALTNAAASGNTVYTYTTRMNRPIAITHAVLRDNNSLDIPVTFISQQEYLDLGQKDTTGTVVRIYYDPQLTTGKLYVWPTSDKVDDRLKIRYSRTLEDMDNSTDNFDFPVEWLDAITYNLALRLAPAFHKTEKIAVIGPLATQFKEDMLSWDREKTSVYVRPDCNA